MTNKKNKIKVKAIETIRKKSAQPPPVVVKVVEKPPAKKKNGPVTVKRSVAQNLGDAAGGLVHNGVGMLSKWLGFGAYTINKNTVIGAGGSIPSMHSTNDSIIVRHREFIGNVYSTTGFASNIISLNPGISNAFPWLSKTAQNYQEYKILGMVVEYIPMLSEVATNELSLGTVVLAAQYRTDLPQFPSIPLAMESEFAVSTKPNLPTDLAIECDPAQSPYKTWYVRTNAVTGDIKTFDFVSVSVMTEGMQTGGQLAGQLWSSYEIELMHPTAFLDPPVNTFYMHLWSTTVTTANPTGSVTTISSYINPIGENIIGGTNLQKFTVDGCNVSNPNTGVYAFAMPRGVTGTFAVQMVLAGDADVNAKLDSTFSVANATLQQIYPSANAVIGPIDKVTTPNTNVHWEYMSWFTINNTQAAAGQASIYLGGSAFVAPASNAYIHLYVSQIASGAS